MEVQLQRAPCCAMCVLAPTLPLPGCACRRWLPSRPRALPWWTSSAAPSGRAARATSSTTSCCAGPAHRELARSGVSSRPVMLPSQRRTVRPACPAAQRTARSHGCCLSPHQRGCCILRQPSWAALKAPGTAFSTPKLTHPLLFKPCLSTAREQPFQAPSVPCA